MSAVKLVSKQEEQEVGQLQAQIKELQAKMKQARTGNVTCQVKTTSKGKVGFVLNGLGIPKFFYKQHAMTLFGDSEQSKELRAKIVEWINAQEVLTDKE